MTTSGRKDQDNVDGATGPDAPKSHRSSWRSPPAIAFTTMLLVVVALIDTSSAEREELVRISGEQPGFARVLGGETFGDQMVFAEDSPRQCILSTVQSRETRSRIVAGGKLDILCNPASAPAQVYEVAVDGVIVVSYEDTLQRNAFEHSLKRFSLPILVALLMLQLALVGASRIRQFIRV